MFAGGAAQLVTSPADTPRWRVAAAIFVPLIVIGVAVWTGLRLSRHRPVTWAAALLLNVALAVAYAWFAVAAVTADVPEGMLAFSGLVVGVPLVLLSLVGVGLLLRTPPRRPPSYPA